MAHNSQQPLAKPLRTQLENTVKAARDAAEKGVSALVQIRAYSPVRRRFLPWTLGRVGLES